MNRENVLKTNLKLNKHYKKAYNTAIHDLYHINSELNKYNMYEFINGIESALENDLFIKECFENKRVNNKLNDENIINLKSTNIEDLSSNFFTILQSRRSLRNFTGEKILFEDLSNLLIFSSGVTGNYEANGKNKPATKLLAYPLAGGIQCLDLYISIKSVEGIENGLYFFNPDGDILNFIKSSCNYNYDQLTLSTNISKLSSVTIYIVGKLECLGYKYGDRAYRFMLLEAGHLAQNIYLVGTALNLGVVASGGYIDDEIKKLIELENSYILYELFIGNINTNSRDPRFLE